MLLKLSTKMQLNEKYIRIISSKFNALCSLNIVKCKYHSYFSDKQSNVTRYSILNDCFYKSPIFLTTTLNFKCWHGENRIFMLNESNRSIIRRPIKSHRKILRHIRLSLFKRGHNYFFVNVCLIGSPYFSDKAKTETYLYFT